MKIKKQGSPPANTQIIAPGADLAKPRQKKPHEVEADNPESGFSHEESVPMFDFGAGAGYTVRNPIKKRDVLLSDAEIVERLREVAVWADADEARRLFGRALKFASHIRSVIALHEAQGYIELLAHKAEMTGEVDKARVYLKPGEEPPEGVQTKEGPRGGRYYESDQQSSEPKQVPIGQMGTMEKSAWRLADRAVDIARKYGWSPDITMIRAYTQVGWERFWGSKVKAEGLEIGGKKVSNVLPYAYHQFGVIGLGPKAVRDLEGAARGAIQSKYGVHALAHEIIHACKKSKSYWV
jgi:hypothetical protein